VHQNTYPHGECSHAKHFTKRKRKTTWNQMEPNKTLKLLCHLEGNENQERGENQGANQKGTKHRTSEAKQIDPHQLTKK